MPAQTKSGGSVRRRRRRFLRPAPGRPLDMCRPGVRVPDQRCGKHELNLHEINFVLENTFAPQLLAGDVGAGKHVGGQNAHGKQLGVSQ